MLGDADLEVLKDGSLIEAAAVELTLAEVLYQLTRTQQAVDLLDARAKSIEMYSEKELPQGSAVVLRLRETRMKMLEAMGTETLDQPRWMAEQIVMARAHLAARQPAAVYQALPAVLKYFERDQSRFRERLDCALLLARAMDALGSGKAAYETLDQKQLTDDARILGPEHPLSRDFEAMRAKLRPSK